MIIFALPAITFFALLFLERCAPVIKQAHRHSLWDRCLNAIGLIIQGCMVPLLGYWLSQAAFPALFQTGKGILQFGWWGCFLLNIVFVDFLYYWQHRAFHHFALLWNLHHCHHAAHRVDIWTTSRNSILINFLFVYCSLNPFLAYCCDSPEGFYAGAMLTASLDVFRHTRLDLNALLPRRLLRALSYIIVMPCQHHQHHQQGKQSVNLAANFILWDILFGTSKIDANYPEAYGVPETKHPLKQLLYPF